jgi:putative methylase
LVRKRDLERLLSEIQGHPEPNAYLEQYVTPSNVAAELLYLAAYVNDDIIDKTVIDLGCGTGRLSIGAALLGAKEVVGVDLDRASVRVRKRTLKL